MAITFFGVGTVPADNSTNTTSPSTITPPSSMVAGDLCVIVAVARATSGTLSVSTTGGQTWTTITQYSGTTIRQIVAWCRFNGTWAANPQVTFGSTTNNEAQMLVFRPTAGTNTWSADVAIANTAVSAPTTPFTVSRTGITTAASSVALAVFHCIASNTWGTLTGANWSKTSLAAQYRCTSGSGQSSSFAYALMPSGGATGTVTQNESASTAGSTHILSWKEVTPTAPTVTTQAVSSIGATTATGNGNVTSDGGSAITERGVCWKTSTGPTTSDSTATSSGTTGAYTPSMTSLLSNTLYYVKAYAINAVGTSYGSEVTFTSLKAFADIRSDIVNGLTSAQSEAHGWNVEVKAALLADLSSVVRTSDTVVTITLPSDAAYDITAQESITATVPAVAVAGAAAIVATPTFTVDYTTGGAASITGAGNIASATAFGSGVVSVEISSAGIASGEAIGQPTVSTTVAAQNIVDAGGIASGAAVGAATLSAGVLAAGIASSESVGASVVSVAISSTGIASAGAIGSASVSAGVVATGIASGEAEGQPSVSVGITATGISSLESLGQPALSVAIVSAEISSAEALGQPTITAVSGATIYAVGIDSAETLGHPAITAVTPHQNIVDAGGITNQEGFGNPALSLTISATGVVTAAIAGQPSVSVNIATSGIDSSELLGQPELSTAAYITGAGIKEIAPASGQKIIIIGGEFYYRVANNVYEQF